MIGCPQARVWLVLAILGGIAVGWGPSAAGVNAESAVDPTGERNAPKPPTTDEVEDDATSAQAPDTAPRPSTDRWSPALEPSGDSPRTAKPASARHEYDPFEPDDACSSARAIAVDGPTQQRDFYGNADEDWLRFDTTAGGSYVIVTRNLGAEADTVLTLYDGDCRTPLRQRDDWPGEGYASRIYWYAQRGGTMFVRVTTLSDSTDTTETGYEVGIATAAPFIDVYVEGSDGYAVGDAVVEAYTDLSHYGTPATVYTDNFGWAPLEVGTQPHTIYALSGRQYDGFILRRDNIAAPSRVTMRAMDAAHVTLKAIRVDGAPFAPNDDPNVANPIIRLSPNFYSFGSNGRVDGNGEARMRVTPGYYQLAAWDWKTWHALSRADVYLGPGTQVTLDAQRMPVARVQATNVDGVTQRIGIWNQVLNWGPYFRVNNGGTMIVSEDYHRINVQITRQASPDETWFQSLDQTGIWNWGARVWTRGGTTIQLRVGPSVRLRTATYETVYRPADSVMLVNAITDAYGNGISYVEFESPSSWGEFRPHTIVRSPTGRVVYDNDGYGGWAIEYFDLPDDAVPGRYTVETNLNTGPFGGMLRDTAEFHVLANRWTWPPDHWRSIFLPLLQRNDGYIEACNGGFENGLAPCWNHGGPLSRAIVGITDDGTPPIVGQAALRLGDPGYGFGLPGQSGIPIGAAWVEQRIQVPDTKFAAVEFWYRMITYDVARSRAGQWYDVFEASVIDGTKATQGHLDGNFEPNTSRQRHDLGWRFGRVDLTPWRGRVVTVRFLNWNGIDPQAPEADRNNTWTFLDDVNVRYY